VSEAALEDGQKRADRSGKCVSNRNRTIGLRCCGSEKRLTPAARCFTVGRPMDGHGLSQRRAPAGWWASIIRFCAIGASVRTTRRWAVGCGSWLSNAAGSSIGGFFDTDGDPLYAQGGDQGRAALRYYLSRSLVNGFVGDDRKGWSIAAPELERAVAIAAQHILSDRAGMLEVIEHSQLRAPDLRGTIDSSMVLCRRLQDEAEARTCMAEIIERIELCNDGIRVALKLTVPCALAGCGPAARLASPASCRWR